MGIIHEYYSLANDDIIKVIPYDTLIRYDNTLISLPHEFISKLKASNELDTNKVTEFYVKPAEVDNYQKVISGLDKILLPGSVIYGYDFSNVSKYSDNMSEHLSYKYADVSCK